MKIKNAPTNSGFKNQQKKPNNNQYRKKLDNLLPGNVLLPDTSSTNCFKLRNIKPPIKNVRVPTKIHYGPRFFPYLYGNQDDKMQKQLGTISQDLHQSKKDEINSNSNGKRNVELLDHMIEILRNKDLKQQQPRIRVNTEPDNFNQFSQIESYSTKNTKGPILDPKMSKFYEKKYFRRQIFSEQKQRNLKMSGLHNQRLSIQKNDKEQNMQLMTFYNKKQDQKPNKIPKIDISQNQFM